MRSTLIRIFSLALFAFGSLASQAQTPCYKPLTGPGKYARPVVNGLICIGCYDNNLRNVVDGNINNSVNVGSLVSIFGGNGLAVVDSVNTYPGGYITGFNVDLGTNLLNGAFLNAFTIQTYNNGVFQEQTTTATLFAAPILGGTSQRSFLYFHTTLPFDEVRLVQTGVGTFLQALNVYYAMAFSPDCGILDNNGICDDAIQGPATNVSFNSALLNPLSTLINPERIVDGDKTNYGSLIFPVGLVTSASVGVLDVNKVYPAGQRAGFVISPNDASTILNADFLNSITVETYLFGKLQDSQTFSNGNGLLNFSALTWGSGINKQRVSIVTTKKFNEVRLKANQLASVNIGTLRVYYAFEEPQTCTDCANYLTTGNSSPYTGSLVTGNISNGFFGIGAIPWTGRYGLSLSALTNTGRVVDNDYNNYADYTPVVGLFGSGMNLTVKNNGPLFPAGTFGAFTIEKTGALVEVGLLEAITVTFYNGSSATESKTGGSLVGGSILNTNGGKTSVGFTSTKPFNRIRININDGLVSAGLGGNYRIYYGYVIGDIDGDGVPDCRDLCPNGNDNIDTDGDGIPDACDVTGPLCDYRFKSAVEDRDSDGVVDACDLDSDNDGIPDTVEDYNGNGDPTDDDFDLDLLPDYIDLDSDNDGVLDLFEAGVPAGIISNYDADHNGVLSFAIGANGLLDALETAADAGSVTYTIKRTRPGVPYPDYLNTNSSGGAPDISGVGRDDLDSFDANGEIDNRTDNDADGIADVADSQVGQFGSPGSPIPSTTAQRIANRNLGSLQQAKLGVYPNPLGRGQTLKLVSNGSSSFQVMDMRGSLLQRGSFSGSANITGLRTGMYMVQVKSQAATQTFKIIVQ